MSVWNVGVHTLMYLQNWHSFLIFTFYVFLFFEFPAVKMDLLHLWRFPTIWKDIKSENIQIINVSILILFCFWKPSNIHDWQRAKANHSLKKMFISTMQIPNMQLALLYNMYSIDELFILFRRWQLLNGNEILSKMKGDQSHSSHNFCKEYKITSWANTGP